MQATEFRDRNWKRLLTEIEQGCVVPVIGPELLKVTVQGHELLLHQYLAEELADRLEVNVPEGATLDQVVWAYRDQPHTNPDEPYYEIWDLLKDLKVAAPEPLRQLAQIDEIQLFVSTTFDGLMAQALNEVRFGGEPKTVVRAYRKPGPGDDVTGIEAAATVYHVFGQASTLPTFVLTDEDQLEFGHLWQDQDHRPARLRSFLQDKFLIMLGCSFPDWFARFLLCALKFDNFADRASGRRGVIADEQSRLDQELTLFLAHCNTQIYTDGGGIEFVRELSRRWQEHVASAAPVPAASAAAPNPSVTPAAGGEDFVKGSIFISYASEDRQAAGQITAALEAAGIDVWYDRKQLESGDDYRAKILRNIEASSFFVPVISNHVLTPERRFFRLEWNHAIEESRMRPAGAPFLLPVVIDNTPPGGPFLPPEFSQVQWEPLPNGVATENFLAVCRKRIRALRRQEVGT